MPNVSSPIHSTQEMTSVIYETLQKKHMLRDENLQPNSPVPASSDIRRAIEETLKRFQNT